MEKEKVKSFIEELGLENLSEEEKKELLDTWSETLQDRVTVRIMDSLLEEEKAELDELAGKGDDKKTNAYLEEHVPGLNIIIEEELEAYKSELKVREKEISKRVEELRKQENL